MKIRRLHFVMNSCRNVKLSDHSLTLYVPFLFCNTLFKYVIFDSFFNTFSFFSSPNFPHKKYTLGYAGRPGGPDFYISTLDNTRNHGPGGQSSYDDPGEADPCFAKVIAGFDIVDLMHKSAVKPGGYNAMEHNIAIREMTLRQQPASQQNKLPPQYNQKRYKTSHPE